MVKTNKDNGDNEDFGYCNCIQCRRARGEERAEPFVTTNRSIPPEKKSRILTTHDLPNPEDIEEKKRRDEIMKESRKEKEKK